MELYSSDSAPSEARKRGSGGGSPRKHDDLTTGAESVPLLNVDEKSRRRQEHYGFQFGFFQPYDNFFFTGMG